MQDKTAWSQIEKEAAGAFLGQGRFPVPAYSEFMPPPRLGRKPYGANDPILFREDDPLGWHVTEYEEAMELRPGLKHLAGQLVGPVVSRHLLAFDFPIVDTGVDTAPELPQPVAAVLFRLFPDAVAPTTDVHITVSVLVIVITPPAAPTRRRRSSRPNRTGPA